MATPPTTRTLVRRAQEGDREAQGMLFARIYPDILQAARFRLGPALRARLDSLDLAQAALYEAARDLSRFEPQSQGSFRRWLLGILENRIRKLFEFYRARRRDLRREVPLGREPPVAAPADSPAQRLLRLEDRERLEAAMDRLSDEHREVIVCRYYLEMPWREIGAQLGGRSPEAAQMLCRRALARLKELYGKGG
jgi:RNA polymerase sigma-70 factor (subfamily 1)